MLPEGSQLVIIQARSELQSTAQPPSHVPSPFDRRHSLPAHPVVTTSHASGKPDGQKTGSSRFSGSMDGRRPSFVQICGTTIADKAVRHDPVSPFCAAPEQPLLQKSSQQHSCQQRSSREQSSQQGLSQQPSAQQQLLHQQSYQVKLSKPSSSVSPLKVDTAQPVCSQQDSDQVVRCLQRSSCESLVFMLQSEDDEEEIDAQRAITSLAQVDCLCTQCLLQ